MTYLAQRSRLIGLRSKDITKLGLVERPAAWSVAAGFEERPCVEIPYFEADGTPAYGFFRIRYTDTKGGKGSGSTATRYSQPAGRIPRFYLPPTTPWPEIVADSSIAVVITEGEFKALALCKLGYPTIGIGGVWNWKSKKAGLNAIPDFEAFEWSGREVYLAFDSDAADNPDVQKALLALAHELTMRAARVLIAVVPPASDGTAQGIDDHALTAKTRKRQALRVSRILSAAVPFEKRDGLEELNETYTHITRAGGIHSEMFGMQRVSDFVQTISAPTVTTRISLSTGRLIEVSRAREWIAWDQRKRADKLIFNPGLPPGLQKSISAFNLFHPRPAPTKGSVSLFLDLVEHLFSGRKDEINWFLSWVAYPFKHPGDRVLTAVYLFGVSQGVGKGFLSKILSLAHAPYAAKISFTDVVSRWSGSMITGRTLVCIDEGEDDHLSRPVTGRLKMLVAEDEFLVEQKYQPHYTLENRAQYLLTTNHANSIHIEAQDRRFFVSEMPRERLPEKLRFKLNDWAKQSDTGAKLRHYLGEHRLDSSFHPKRAAPETSSRAHLVDMTGSALDLFARGAVNGQWQGWHLPELTTARAMLAVYDPEGRQRVTPSGMALALIRAGASRVGPGKTRMVLVDGQGQVGPIALRNVVKWQNLSTKAYLEGLRNLLPSRSKTPTVVTP